MSKVVIAASASLQDEINKWKKYWEENGHKVVDDPKAIPKETFTKDYPSCYKDFFANLSKADILFALNEDRKDIHGYIGAETFAEIGFAIASNALKNTNVRVLIYKMPSKDVPGYDEVKLWLELGWMEIFSEGNDYSTPKDKEKQRHEIFGRIPIKGANELRKHLKISEDSYRYIYGPNAGRDYLLYGMLDEVEKAGLSLMHTSDFILESRKDSSEREDGPDDKRITHNIFQSRIDETVLWERKLSEQLIDLVGFRRAKDDAYYRHYLALRELERTQKIYSDFKEYHGASNKNLQHQVDMLKKQIDQIATGLDDRKCWYVKNPSGSRDRYKIADLKTRLNKVLPFMTDAQKLAIGISYSSYSIQSQSLHPSQARIQDVEATMKRLDDYFMRVSMLSGHVAIAIKDALRLHNKKGYLKELAGMFKTNPYPAELLSRLTKPDIEVGDFVTAYNDLAEVKRVIRSPYGYRSFAVRYLERPPLPHITVEEMPARYVRLLYKRKDVAGKVRDLINQEAPGVEPSARGINTALRKTIIHTWSIGMKEIVQGNPDAGYEKMRQYIKQEKKDSKKRGSK